MKLPWMCRIFGHKLRYAASDLTTWVSCQRRRCPFIKQFREFVGQNIKCF